VRLNLSELNQQVELLCAKYALVLNDDLSTQLVEKLHALEQQIPAHERLIEQLHAYEQQLNQLKIEQQQLVEQLQTLKIALSQSSANQTASSAQLLQIQQELAQTDKLLMQASQQLSTELLAYSIEPISLEQIGVIKQQLQQRVTNWQTQQQQADQLQQVINQFANEMQQNAMLQESITQTLQQTRLELEHLQHELSALVSKRHELFADKEVNQEQANWQQHLELLESNYQTTQNNYTQARQELVTLQSLLANQAEQFQPLQAQCQQTEANFQQSLMAQGFSDELDFKAKLLSREIIAEIQQRANRLQQNAIELNMQQQLIKARISSEENKALTTLSLAELAAQITQLAQTIDNYTQQIGAYGLQLKLNEQAQQQQAEIIARHSQQKIINQRWGNLHKLIGSADGKKYRNFAQGLTFEMVVKHANQQLLNMSDRYLLMRDKEAPLELNVVDNYQGGEIRSTKNLSGGESFVISLALALGLSKLSSNKVQVDSLFLDEGFGTLDEDALQTALNALDSLQRDGKLIGIISHVGALKERINLQIQVEPLSGGVSRISGVGCSGK
jgi:exonuclease SbcC